MRGREVWERRVRRLRESDLTVAEFAAELGVKPSTLTYWKWRLAKEARGTEGKVSKVPRAPKFVEVKAADERLSKVELRNSADRERPDRRIVNTQIAAS